MRNISIYNVISAQMPRRYQQKYQQIDEVGFGWFSVPMTVSGGGDGAGTAEWVTE
jgi:hypothetical protein